MAVALGSVCVATGVPSLTIRKPLRAVMAPSTVRVVSLSAVSSAAVTSNCATLGASRTRRQRMVVAKANPQPSDFDLSNYMEAKIAHVRHTTAYGHMMFLKLVESNMELPVYIGEYECAALVKEINKSPAERPMTHDLMKNTVEAMGFRVSKVCVTALIGNTYHASIHYLKTVDGVSEEVVLDARPSDAMNMAVRFQAMIYVNKQVAAKMGQAPGAYEHKEESKGEIVASVRKAILHFNDPTVMYKLQMQVAIEEERYDDAAQIRDKIDNILSTNRQLGIRVAMETALNDERYAEAAALRDELLRLQQQSKHQSQASD